MCMYVYEASSLETHGVQPGHHLPAEADVGRHGQGSVPPGVSLVLLGLREEEVQIYIYIYICARLSKLWSPFGSPKY